MTKLFVIRKLNTNTPILTSYNVFDIVTYLSDEPTNKYYIEVIAEDSKYTISYDEFVNKFNAHK